MGINSDAYDGLAGLIFLCINNGLRRVLYYYITSSHIHMAENKKSFKYEYRYGEPWLAIWLLQHIQGKPLTGPVYEPYEIV